MGLMTFFVGIGFSADCLPAPKAQSNINYVGQESWET